MNRLPGGIRTCARQHLHPAPREFDGQADDPVVFLEVESRGFAGRTHRNDAIDPSFDLHLHQAPERGFIDLTVTKRRD